MDKKDCIIPYYNGNLEYAVFLLNNIYNYEFKTPDILKKENINAAKMGAISNILLAIKEDIIEEEKNYKFKPKILVSELEKAVGCIATKEKEGYKIDGFLFEDAPSLVAELRNKIAHGNYTLDLEHSRIILKKDGQDIKININKLQHFIIMAFKNYKIKVSEDKFERDIMLYEKVDTYRSKPIESIEELIKVIKGFNRITFTLSGIGDTKVNPTLMEQMNLVIRQYKQTLDNQVLYDFQKMVKPNYSFKWEITKVKKFDVVKELIAEIESTFPKNIDYMTQIKKIGMLIQRTMGVEYNNFGPIAGNLKSLILIDNMYEQGTINKDVLLSLLNEEYGDFTIDYDMYASSVMAMFNSLFSYARDDIYKNEDFDYSKIDLSLLEIDYLKIDETKLEEITNQLNAQFKQYVSVKERIDENKKNLEKVDSSNTNAITNLNNQRNRLKLNKSLVENEIVRLMKEQNNIIEEYVINADKIRNSTIIERIRNSIAHGNYQVKINDSLTETIIVFEDIYNDELKLRASIEVFNLIKLLNTNAEVVNEFVEGKENSKVR